MRSHMARKAPLFILILVFSLLLLAVASPSAASPAEQIGTGYIGNASYVNMRSGPSVGYPVVTRLGSGAYLTLISRNADSTWYEVEIAGGIRGWVNSRYVVTSTPPQNLPPTSPLTVSNAVVTSAYYLNIRSGPSAGFGIVGRLSRGEPVTLIGRVLDNSWLEVSSLNGTRGWVNSSYVTANININTLPISGNSSGVPTQPPPANASPTGVVTANYLNVRYLPGVWSAIIGSVGQGQSISLIGRDQWGSWLLIQAPGGFTGWVSATYVIPSVPIANLPVAA